MKIFELRKIYLYFIIICMCSSVLFAYEMDECIMCHSDNPGEGIPQISAKDYTSSIHGSMMECVSCHTYIEDGHEEGGVTGKVNCGNCHSLENLHGQSSANKNKPECYTCHTKHKILPKSVESSSINKTQLKMTCKNCHPEKWGEQGFLRRLASIRVKSHKKQDFSKDYNDTNCTGCHQGMAVHGSPEKISDEECFKCHMKDNRNAMIGKFHAADNSGLSIAGIAILTMIIVIFIFLAGFIFSPPGKSGKGKE